MFLDGFDWDDQEKTNERIIDALIKKVILYDNKIEIYFNIGPGEDPGKTVDIKVFDSGATCSTKCDPSRTLFISAAGVGISIKI